jgi:hypothetical protein
MTVAAGFDYDIFVSYAHADDIAAGDQDGWVAQFVRHLEAALRQRLGGTAALRVFFDSRTTGANSHLPELLAAARGSALFLAVGSPSYAVRDWPHQELQTFVAQTPDLSRLFMIECLPLSEDERYPAPLDNHIHLEFWKPSGRRQIPMAISPVSDAQEFSTLVHALASDIREKLLWVRHTTAARQSDSASLHPAPSPEADRTNRGPRLAPPRARRTILLAQTTDDVQEEADQLLRYLNQFEDEVTVLPRSGYPQGGDAFMAAFRRDLAQADLFVQLLSRRIGRVPPDLPLGYTRFQLEAARSAAVEIMQWRHPDIDPSPIGDPAYHKLLTAETVVASGLEAFKSQVLTWARRRPQEPRKSASRSESPTVFINADHKDIAVAKEIERECLRHALTTFLPMSGPSSEASRRDLEENLTDCDVLLFIYGDTTQDWIRSQLRFFGKVKPRRDADPKLLAICSGPPAQKPDIGVTVPNARILSCPDGWDMATVSDLLAGLAQ